MREICKHHKIYSCYICNSEPVKALETSLAEAKAEIEALKSTTPKELYESLAQAKSRAEKAERWAEELAASLEKIVEYADGKPSLFEAEKAIDAYAASKGEK